MSQARSATRRLWCLLAIILGVMALHGWLTWSMAELIHAQQGSDDSDIRRMEATYVSELKLSAPPVAARPTPPAGQPRPPSAKRPPRQPEHTPSEPQQTASAPAESASVPDAPPEALASVASTAEEATAAAPPAPAASAWVEAPAAKGPPFVWPIATRVSYKVRGYFRGDVHGQAKVEWVRQDHNYQVHVDTTIGPSFAPIGSWKLTSAGVITPDGLTPQRFEQVNRLLIRTSAPRKIVFEEHDVVLDSGERLRKLPGMQDAASQFIQLAYQFIMNPALLTPGNVIQIPLALPKKLETIAYDVIDAQELDTPIGKVPTFHVRPRKMSTEGGVLPVEIWFAPGLQYLPVRILVKADEKTYMDLRMERAPEQAPAEAASGAAKPAG